MTMSLDRPVVVGTDGSAAALAAVRHAADEAAARRCPLLVVHAVGDGETAQQRDLVVQRALALVRDTNPDVVVRYRLAAWDPAAVLGAASKGARLLVVGMAGKNDPPEAANHSVALDVLHRSHCPVAVVRARHRRHQAVVRALLTGTADGVVLAEAAVIAQTHATPLVVDRLGAGSADAAVAVLERTHPTLDVVKVAGTNRLGRLLDRAEGAVALVVPLSAGPACYDDPARAAVHRGPCPVTVVPTAPPVVPGRPTLATSIAAPES
jgi:nucleotide-binding universal stress UspA family protein